MDGKILFFYRNLSSFCSITPKPNKHYTLFKQKLRYKVIISIPVNSFTKRFSGFLTFQITSTCKHPELLHLCYCNWYLYMFECKAPYLLSLSVQPHSPLQIAFQHVPVLQPSHFLFKSAQLPATRGHGVLVAARGEMGNLFQENVTLNVCK